MAEPGIGWMSNRPPLHRGIDRHSFQIFGFDRPGLVGHRKARQQQRNELLVAYSLAPTRQPRAIELRVVAKHHLAAKVLEIPIFQPSLARRSSDRLCMCLRMKRPATNRVGNGGWPGPVRQTEPKRWPRNLQSVSSASRTSGWRKLMMSAGLIETDCPDGRRAVSSSALPKTRISCRRNHRAPKSEIQECKKTDTIAGFLQNRLLARMKSDQSIGSEFFTRATYVHFDFNQDDNGLLSNGLK
jgi:hypothetical protein